MPSLDLLEEQPQCEPADNDPFGSVELQRKRYDAALEFATLLQETLSAPEGKVHAGTVLSVAAWLTGTSLYRSMRYKIQPEPGTIMLSNEINEAWPTLLNLFLYYCQRNGMELKPEQFILNVPEEHKPQIEILQAQEQFQERYYEIMRKHGLDYLDGARAGVIVCAMEFYYHCTHAREIDPNLAAGLISSGIVTAAKTVPAPLKPGETARGQTDPPRKNPLFDVIPTIARNSTAGSGTRLVLGEGMASMREALNRGGKYILVHPDVLSTLQANGIDPFPVYAAAMQLEVASGIPQIDFTGADVDLLLQQWSGRSETELPIHVRQIQWLKDNALRCGYRQVGNSWILAH